MINAKTENTIKKLFVLAIELEYKTADIYEKFAKLFPHVPGLPAFSNSIHIRQGLRDDEIQHVITLQNVSKSLIIRTTVGMPTQRDVGQCVEIPTDNQ